MLDSFYHCTQLVPHLLFPVTCPKSPQPPQVGDAPNGRPYLLLEPPYNEPEQRSGDHRTILVYGGGKLEGGVWGPLFQLI